MRQWTGFEPLMSNVVVVDCQLISRRRDDDRWGPAVAAPQEIPACYFTRNFSVVKSYLGDGKWRAESQLPGPPWGKAKPPRKAMAFFAPAVRALLYSALLPRSPGTSGRTAVAPAMIRPPAPACTWRRSIA